MSKRHSRRQSAKSAFVEDFYKNKISRSLRRDVIHEYDPALERDVRSKRLADTDEMYDRINEFADKVYSKYGRRNLPIHKVFEKAARHTKYYNINAKEFDVFRLLYQHKLNNPESRLRSQGSNKLGSVLGDIMPTMLMKPISADKLGDRDRHFLTKLESIAKYSNHPQSVMQNFTYLDCALNVLMSYFDATKDNPHCHTHPVLVAMFVPKIKVFDDRMLNSNLAKVITGRRRGYPIEFKPDYELLHDLITDPNDVVCSSTSSWEDLYRRANFQELLRTIVFNLRGGQVFNCDNDTLIRTINECRASAYDHPNLLYVRDEGTIMRRILNIFAFRPTYMSSARDARIFTPFGQRFQIGSSSRIPMVHVPLIFKDSPSAGVSLLQGINQPQLYLENNVLVTKKKQLSYTDRVLIFYANRRYKKYKSTHKFYACTELPVNIQGVEKMNATPVLLENSTTLKLDNDEEFLLRSVVCIDTDRNPNLSVNDSQTIVGCSTMLFVQPRELGLSNPEGKAAIPFRYDPLSCVNPRYNLDVANMEDFKSNSPYERTQPFHRFGSGTGGNDLRDALNYCSRHGTIYIYTPISKASSDPSCSA